MTTPDEREVPEACTSCGACCFSESPHHVNVTGDDHARLGDDADGLVVWHGNRAFMRLERVAGQEHLHRCAALVIDASAGTFLCSVYERRPAVCRELEQASGACRGELAAKGERPRRALVVLAAAARGPSIT